MFHQVLVFVVPCSPRYLAKNTSSPGIFAAHERNKIGEIQVDGGDPKFSPLSLSFFLSLSLSPSLSLTRFHTHSLASHTHSHTHTLTHTLTHSLTHSLTHTHTQHSLRHTLTHTPTFISIEMFLFRDLQDSLTTRTSLDRFRKVSARKQLSFATSYKLQHLY